MPKPFANAGATAVFGNEFEYSAWLPRQRSCACCTAVIAVKASARRLFRTESWNEGSATAARMATTTKVTINSMSVKPWLMRR